MAFDLRRSTVYDFSDLRLHPNGTRIQQTDKNYGASSKRNLTVKDAQGKWRANDAAGLGTVPRAHYRAESTKEYERGKERQLHAKRGRISLGEKKRVRPLEHRTISRWKFEESLDFLDGTSNRAIKDKTYLPVPSSELIKNIHYIAAKFYTECGQLLNLGQAFRAEQKRKRKEEGSVVPRKRRRLMDEITGTGTDQRKTPDFDSDEYSGSSSSDPRISGPSSSSASEAPSDTEHEGSVTTEDAGDTLFISNSIKERRKRYTRSLHEIRQKHQQDMYKVMDGSALMVLGMLVQEHVAKLVQGKVPEGWEEGLPLGDEKEWSEEEREQVESEREGGEDEYENENDENESEIEEDGDDSDMTDDAADGNNHEEKEIREKETADDYGESDDEGQLSTSTQGE